MVQRRLNYFAFCNDAKNQRHSIRINDDNQQDINEISLTTKQMQPPTRKHTGPCQQGQDEKRQTNQTARIPLEGPTLSDLAASSNNENYFRYFRAVYLPSEQGQ